jgi:hypothetical protein
VRAADVFAALDLLEQQIKLRPTQPMPSPFDDDNDYFDEVPF